MNRLLASLILFALVPAVLPAVDPPSTFVDDHGVMRWTATKAEVVQFGVNYTTPFAHAFRAHKRLGVDWRDAIAADVYHLARLGLDAYRVHMWDREITDEEGNLLVNEHMQAHDFLLSKLKERGIKSILTPLQFGNAAYPEGGVPLRGFSSRYGKQGSLENRESWPFQIRYLTQLMEHVNPHTGLAYKDDPDILAFEICNEPGHWDYALTVDYINTMVKAIRDTGCQKPIFYNMSHGLSVFRAYLDADVQGGTFQWYPANLVANHEQRGNFLPYVDDYPIPFADEPSFRNKARIIYEFDPADIGRGYIYPAMARTFRKIGAQIATQFAYDPLHLAPFNTEYQTHYLNLAYAPQKALGMMVAGEAFRHVPLFKDYGRYPANTSFAGVRLSYADDLAEFVTEEKFFHSNTTSTPPPAPARLSRIAGYGNSPLVTYPGQGAYFLDRLEPGVWRLEVMPDAIWVRDPFEKPSPRKPVVRIAWNEWPLRIGLPDLGDDFEAVGINPGNGHRVTAVGGTLGIRPGTYLLARKGVRPAVAPESKWAGLTLNEFVAPPATVEGPLVVHAPLTEAAAGERFIVPATIAASEPIERVELVAYLPQPRPLSDRRSPLNPRAQPGAGNTPGTGAPDLRGARIFPMRQVAGLQYLAEIPGSDLRAGQLAYHVVVRTKSGARTFPSGHASVPTDWDFHGAPWTTRLVAPTAPVLLFDAAADTAAITGDHRDVRYDLVPSDRPGTTAVVALTRDLDEKDHDHSLRFFFKDKIRGRTSALGTTSKLVLYGRSATDNPCTLQLSLVTSDGIAYGGIVQVQPVHGTCSLPLAGLRPVRSPNIPHGYPSFIPFWSEPAPAPPLDPAKVESILISIGPGIPESGRKAIHGVEIERIWLD